jgi:catechol 2,3-dioxygenase-like lactoylglutathione lyase family enzyme
LSPGTAELPFVHIGILVENIDEAIPRYEQLGITFMPPQRVHVDRLIESGHESSFDLRVAFSHQGPPQWELLEAVGDGVYGPQHAGGIHHVAVLDPDPERRIGELVAQGFRFTGAQYRPDGSMIVGYLDPNDLDGVRIEVLHAPVQDAIAAWVAGRDASP